VGDGGEGGGGDYAAWVDTEVSAIITKPRAAPEPTCDTCRFYGILKTGTGELQTICRRYPPRVFVQFFPTAQGFATPTVSAYPSVSSGDRCGEHSVGAVMVS